MLIIEQYNGRRSAASYKRLKIRTFIFCLTPSIHHENVHVVRTLSLNIPSQADFHYFPPAPNPRPTCIFTLVMNDRRRNITKNLQRKFLIESDLERIHSSAISRITLNPVRFDIRAPIKFALFHRRRVLLKPPIITAK